LSNMSHEFRTPLNSILALSRLLVDDADGSLNAEQQRQVGYIRKSAQELLDLVNDLLDLAKVEAGKIEIKPIEFTIAELFSALRGALRPLKSSVEVDLVFEAAEDLPALFTDEGKVAQVLRNFISNALKFTEHGEVRVSAHFDSRAKQILFLVSDTGIGIAPPDQARIFEEFSQVDGHLQKAGKGTGLGLPLSKQLAHLLGGEIWVESEPGKGSKFFLSIPAKFARSELALRAPETNRRRRVLVIDDDETFRYVLRQIVGDQLRHEVFEANDGEQGLNRIRELHPDVVFLDLQMPKVDGFAVLEAVRNDPRTRELPVIVFTSMRLTDDIEEQLPKGTPIVAKDSVSREQVHKVLKQALH
ncbi:MAG TPA: ATP-binding protein, partial [Steroidobacteraceae bacterium]|nr:ATP-binding protein [Steroidobacteraceae bacterium]